MASLATVVLVIFALGGFTSEVSSVDGSGWTKKHERTVVIGCFTQLLWRYNEVYNDVLTITKNGIPITTLDLKEKQKSETSDGKYEIEMSRIRDETHIVLTINNITKDDEAIYACDLNNNDLRNYIQLFVKNYEWENEQTPISVKKGDSVTMTWQFDVVTENRNIFVYFQDREDPKEDQPLGMWISDVYLDDIGLERMQTNKSVSEDGGKETVSLTIANTTYEDFRFSYHLRVDLNMDQKTCSKYSKPITLEEDVGFTWTSTGEDVSSPLGHSVELVWEFETRKPPTRIVFTRENTTSNTVTPIGTWTFDSGFVVNLTSAPKFSRRYVNKITQQTTTTTTTQQSTTTVETAENVTEANTNSTDRDLSVVAMSEREEVQGEIIVLKLPVVMETDVGLVYYCHVYSGPWFHSRQGRHLVVGEEKKVSSSKLDRDQVFLYVSVVASIIILTALIFITALVVREILKRKEVKAEPKSGTSTTSNSPHTSRYPYKAMNGGFTSYLRSSDQSTPLVNGTARQYSNEHIDWIGETRSKNL